MDWLLNEFSFHFFLMEYFFTVFYSKWLSFSVFVRKTSLRGTGWKLTVQKDAFCTQKDKQKLLKNFSLNKKLNLILTFTLVRDFETF